ncbi:hypothetical protein BK143_20215 [Paenibacillus peoriae]|nr:hypothetical protein BK143_20215 [Paenibacillus peoriae]OMF76610.1 hypothetical protein BK145_22010 [Paenibacillus peoriae]POR26520.1 hypothetical protein CG775_18195 [Paenibacillus polymyxa]
MVGAWEGIKSVMRALRERIILPIAVAPGFLDWNKPVKVGIQRQRQALRFSRTIPSAPLLPAPTFMREQN